MTLAESRARRARAADRQWRRRRLEELAVLAVGFVVTLLTSR